MEKILVKSLYRYIISNTYYNKIVVRLIKIIIVNILFTARRNVLVAILVFLYSCNLYRYYY